MKIIKIRDDFDSMGLAIYKTDTNCRIIIENHINNLWHLSISHKDRYPTWDEIKYAREQLLDKDKVFAMIFPKESDYVNIHNNCFHLFELKPQETQGIPNDISG